MRISFCVLKNITYGGGIEKYTLELGSRLARRGHEITVYTMKHYGKVTKELQHMRIIGVPSIPGKNTEKFTASASAAFQTLFNPKVDIVHFQHISSGWAAWVSKLRRQKCVLQLHGIGWRGSKWGCLASRFLQALETTALRQCDVATSVSKINVTYYQEKYGVNIVYIPSGVSLMKKVEPKEILSRGLLRNSYILFVGRLSREKGLHYLIPAFREVKTDLKLVIAGQGYDKNYNNELFKLASGDERVRFAGFAQGRLLDELFSNALIYVQPSEFEGLSIALLEAMSYGNCCLVSDIPENIEAIDQAGFTFRSQDVNDLTGKIRFLLDNRSDIDAKSQQAISRVKANYTWDSVTDKIERLYESVLAS